MPDDDHRDPNHLSFVPIRSEIADWSVYPICGYRKTTWRIRSWNSWIAWSTSVLPVSVLMLLNICGQVIWAKLYRDWKTFDHRECSRTLTIVDVLDSLPLLHRTFGDNKRPFIYFEVIDLGGEPIKNTEYTGIGRVSEFRYGKFLSEVFRKQFGQKLKFLNNFGVGQWWREMQRRIELLV